mgnify:CR=1 FL=1
MRKTFIFVVRDRVVGLLPRTDLMFFNKMRPKTTFVTYIILAILTFIPIGCGVTGSNPAPNSQLVMSSTFKVAMTLPDAIDDGSWSQSGYQGLKSIEKQLGAKIAYTEKTDDLSDVEVTNVFRQYAKEGFDLIIGHGGRFVFAAEIAAKEFPRTKFAVVGTFPGNNRNLAALSFRSGELGYLTGVVAALKTKTNKVSFIGGVDYPHIKEGAILFERGAKATKPDITVIIEWVGNWTDKEKCQKIAEKHIKSGVDVILNNADPGSLPLHQLAKKHGIHTIGWIQDLYQLAPGTVLTSAIQDSPALLLQAATLVREGRWEGKQYKFGLREKVQKLAPFRGSLTPEQEAVVNKVKEDILIGKIDVSP